MPVPPPPPAGAINLPAPISPVPAPPAPGAPPPPPPAGYLPPPQMLPPGLTSTRRNGGVNWIKALVYGRSGVGKTRLAATAPRPLILSVENGLLSLQDYDIPVLEIKTVEDINRALKWLPTATQFDTLFLDSISEIAEVVLVNAKRQVKDGRLAYGAMNDQMIEVIKAFRDIPNKHVIMTAKAEWVKDEGSGMTKWMPSLPGRRLPNGLPYYFDEVWHLGIYSGPTGPFPALQTAADFTYEAKDRSGKLALYEAPNIESVFAKIG